MSTLWKLSLLCLAAAIGAFALSFYTSEKLSKMRMVRGEVPGATFSKGTVVSRRRVGEYGQCELEVVEADSRSRQWADSAACAAMDIGTEVTLARVPGQGVELQGGTWSSDGNMGFDASLLAGERAIAGSGGLGAIVLGIAAALAGRRRPAPFGPG